MNFVGPVTKATVTFMCDGKKGKFYQKFKSHGVDTPGLSNDEAKKIKCAPLPVRHLVRNPTNNFCE